MCRKDINNSNFNIFACRFNKIVDHATFNNWKFAFDTLYKLLIYIPFTN